jgi:hypothetical protein
MSGEQARLHPPRGCGIIDAFRWNEPQNSRPVEGGRKISPACLSEMNRVHT